MIRLGNFLSGSIGDTNAIMERDKNDVMAVYRFLDGSGWTGRIPLLSDKKLSTSKKPWQL